MRLSKANEDSQRASNHQSPPPDRPQTALCLRRRFPKTARLRTRQEFRRVQRQGRRIQGLFLIFQFTSENFNDIRLGMTVSKQFGHAVSRNRLKRRIREVFRLEKHRLPKGLSLHVSPRPGIALPSTKQIQEDFNILCSTKSNNKPLQ